MPEPDVDRPVSRLDHAGALAVVAGPRVREVPECAGDWAVTALTGTTASEGEGLRSVGENRHQGHERDFLDHVHTSFLDVGITQASCRTVTTGKHGACNPGAAKQWAG